MIYLRKIISEDKKTMKIKPLGNRILIKIIKSEMKSPLGLYLPDSAQDKIQKGQVISIGDGENINVKISDKIIYDKYSGTFVKIDEEDHLILNIKDVVAIIED